MKTSNKYSGTKLQIPEIEKSLTRTLEEAMVEIQEIINNTHWVETRLQQLKAKGYQIEESWVKNGSIGTVWYMKRKQVYRIQVTTSELHGDYHKAFCVVIPFNDLSVQISEQKKMRNIPIKYRK
jgi:hypothetical protein